MKKKTSNIFAKKVLPAGNIHSKLLKIGSVLLVTSIYNLANLILMESCLPDILIYAEVAASFKRLDNLDRENCRPISVLMALSKAFEKKSRVYKCHHILNAYFQNFCPLLGLHIFVKPIS